MKFFLLFICLVAMAKAGLSQTPSADGVVYVKKGATGTGSSWASATGEVADALHAAASNANIKQIWVAAGTYYPLYMAATNATTDRDKGFVLVEGVKLYGGFAGTETSVAARTLSSSNASILSGNIGNAATNSDNVFHVVVGIVLSDNVSMDGFTISGGNANSYGSTAYGGYVLLGSVGGGVHLVEARPSFTNMIFCNNAANYYGGGLFANATNSFTLTNCLFSGNSSNGLGGGIACFNSSNPTLTNVTIAGNRASPGGAPIYNNGSTISMNNCMVYGNGSVVSSGGSNSYNISYSLVQGMAADAANHNLDGSSAVSFVNAPSYTTAPYSGGDFRLSSGSAGIDAGSNSLFSGLTASSKDVAGNLRVYNYSDVNAIDMGAYEYQGLNANGIMYVNSNATGAATGSSWMNAATNLGEALRMAQTLNAGTPGTVKQIWVAGGTYYPTYAADFSSTDNRDKAFVMLSDVKIYGGFAGTETTLASRDLTLTTNKTILSGDLGTLNTATDNVYHVVVMAGAAGTAELNGFTVTGGYANGSGSLLTTNGNAVSRSYGGAMQLMSASPVLANLEFISNTGTSGGALALLTGANASLQDVVFNNNTATYGGAVYISNGNTSVFDRVTFSGNSATANGGAINLISSVTPVFKNVQLTGNKAAGNGGAVYIGTNAGYTVTFLNTVLGGNTGNNGAICMYPGNIDMRNSIVYGNSSGIVSKGGSDPNSIVYSLVQGVNADAANNILDGSIDPLFVAPNAYSNAPSTAGNYALQSTSPVMNKGSNAVYTGVDATTTDLAGNARVYNYASGGKIDLGAFEYQGIPGQVITVTDAIKTYGDNAFEPAATASSGLTVTFQSSDNSIAEAFIDAADGNKWKIKIKKTGQVTVTASQSGNADFAAAADKTFTVTIDKAVLTVTAKDSTATYTGVAFSGGNGVTFNGLVNGDDSTVATGTLTYSGPSQGAKNVDTYVITPGGLTAANYTLSYTSGSLEIVKAKLTVTAKDSAKIYDGLAFNGGNGIAVTGFLNNETASVVSGTVTYSGTSQGVTATGTYAITPAGLTAANYYFDYVNGTLTVNKAALSITAKDSAQAYNGVAFAGGNGITFSGFINNEDSATALTGTVAYSGTSQGAVNVNSYTIIPSGLSADNYTITYYNGTLAINKAGLTVAAKDTAKTYDGIAYAGGNGVIYAGFVSGDNESALSGALAYSGTSQGAVNVSKYVITPGGYTSDNYDITYVSNTLTIQQAALTITATDSTKVYDGKTFTGGNGITYSGFINSEDSTQALTGAVTYTGSSQGAVGVNSYDIIPGGLLAHNYSITYNKGTLTVSKAALTVTAKDSSKVYDGLTFNNGNGVTYSGFVNNEDSVVALTGTLGYTGSSQGAKNVNSYAIVPGGLAADNYSLTYTPGTLIITKAALEITARDTVKTYDATAFSNGNGLTYSGFVNNEDATAALTGSVAYSGTSQGAVNSGSYTIVLSGLSADNYTVSYTNGKLTIDKATLVVTANDTARCYGVANPVFRVSYSGWVSNETTAVLTTTAIASTTADLQSAAGSYAIVPSGAIAGNYAISYTNGNLQVNALPVTTISATEGTFLCGADDTLIVTASGNFTYEWYLDNTVIANETRGLLKAFKTGSYTAIAKDANGCVNISTNNVVLTRLLKPTPAFSFDSYCLGRAVTFTNSSDIAASGAVNYTWNSGDGQSSTHATTQFTYNTPGNHTAGLTITPQTCPSLAVTVTHSINIEAFIPGIRLNTVNTTAGLPTAAEARNLTNASYTWMPGSGVSNTAVYNPVITTGKDQDYLIQMEFPSGCVTVDSLLVTAFVTIDVLVANVFTPNGDGQNDLLIANLRGAKQLHYFRVFNRWGKLIFETRDPAKGWDGRYNGELQPLATYVWTAEAVEDNGHVFRRQGSVTLLR